MIFSKKINRLVFIFLLLTLIVCGVRIYDVNSRFPNAREITNDEEDSIYWKGCKVHALDKTIYTVEEYNAAFPEDGSYQYLNGKDNQGSGIVVYRVEVTNMNDRAVRFWLPVHAEAAAFPSTWHNGLSFMSDDIRIDAGETKIMMANAYYAPSLVHFTQLENMEDNEFQLIFSFYPERVVLKFD